MFDKLFTYDSRYESAFRITDIFLGESDGHQLIPLTRGQQSRDLIFSLSLVWTKWIRLQKTTHITEP